ncbi:MAG: ABC transporter permease [Treponema sp.]|jgi:simple sugar transport system permease protein|nr:ABC transporter permease [Treponema sp.]
MKEHKTLLHSKIRSALENAGGLVLILGISLLVLIMLAFLLSRNPVKTLRYFFLGPLQNTYYTGNLINSAIPLIFGGLGISIALRGGNFNLGGEGQIYAGAFAATISALAFSGLGLPGQAGLGLAFLAGSLFAALMAALSGFLKARWNTNELITSFLLSNTLILIINYLVTGPFLDSGTNLQSTGKIPENFRLSRILPPSALSTALLAALIAVVLVHIFLYKTRAGYEIRICGQSPRFAAYGGINIAGTTVLSMFLSGFFYGSGGAMAVFGTYYSTMKEFSAGMGWNSLAVALIARSRPLAVIPAALFFAWIGSGARMAMQFSDMTFEISSIVQSVIFFLVTSSVLLDLFKTKRFRKRGDL